ncbi:hypothetical protein HZS55_09195 [Halosimplex rubrum]|uniref:Uncharacterized protein n=1 Tax=Halosimplex rubrum TaxID=869889 RepID=A0A7D5P988_9EURY|nr:hypothetical protein [Halosimplex rubrum]QLH77460.1 hypothetical protein HZS55_09195 [Halosimplex rubrum]
MSTTSTTQSRIAHLADSDRDDYEHIVHGVAHGEDELTIGKNSPKYWPAEEVEAAAATLEGRTVFRSHGDGDREAIGTVLRAAYEDGVGVVYEAGLEDETIATELSRGDREVSIEAGNASDVERHEDTGAVIMRGYEYTGLATPEKGASAGNYTAPGPAESNPAVAALSAGDIVDVLDTGAELNAYTTESGVRYRGTRGGKLDESAIPNDDYEPHHLFDADTKSASSYPVVDSDGYLRRGNVAAAYSVGPRGSASREDLHGKLRPLNDAFSTPPIDPERLATDAEAEMAALASDLDVKAVAGAVAELAAGTGPDDPADGSTPEGEVLGGAGADASADDEPTDTTDMNNGSNDPDNGDGNGHDVEALLERVDEKDEEIESLQAELEAKEETVAELEEEVEEAKRAYAARLADHNSTLDEDDFVSRFELAELRERFDDLDEDLADDPAPDVQSGGGGGGGNTAALEDEGRERIKEIDQKLAALGSSLPDSREAELREEACELADTDDYEAALEAI